MVKIKLIFFTIKPINMNPELLEDVLVIDLPQFTKVILLKKSPKKSQNQKRKREIFLFGPITVGSEIREIRKKENPINPNDFNTNNATSIVRGIKKRSDMMFIIETYGSLYEMKIISIPEKSATTKVA